MPNQFDLGRGGQGVEKFAGRTHGSSSSSITPHGGSAPPQSPGGALKVVGEFFVGQIYMAQGTVTTVATGTVLQIQ
jgi:hypothetical protein